MKDQKTWLDITGHEDKLPDFLESCRDIVMRDNSCEGVNCKNCPGFGEYNNWTRCLNNNFRNKPTGFKNDLMIKNAKLFIETHGKSNKKGWLCQILECIKKY